MRHILLFSILLALTGGLFWSPSAASAQPAAATGFHFQETNDDSGRILYAVVGGRRREISRRALEAWLLGGGRQIAYSVPAGEFDTALYVHDVGADKSRRILLTNFSITALKEVRISTGESVLLVETDDEALGAAYFRVLDPRRGPVFYRRWALLTAIRGDEITLAFYRERDWEKIHEQAGGPRDADTIVRKTKVKPYKTEKHDLKQIIKNQVRRKKE